MESENGKLLTPFIDEALVLKAAVHDGDEFIRECSKRLESWAFKKDVHKLVFDAAAGHYRKHKTKATWTYLDTFVEANLTKRKADLDPTADSVLEDYQAFKSAPYTATPDDHPWLREKIAEYGAHVKSCAAWYEYRSGMDKNDQLPPDKRKSPAERQKVLSQKLSESVGLEWGETKKRILSFSDLLDLPPAEWLVKGLIRKNESSIVYAEPASYKTFIILDLALSIASGTPFVGHFPVKKKGKVFYVLSEGLNTASHRIRGWSQKRGIPVPDGDSFVISRSIYDLSDAGSTDLLIKDIYDTFGDDVSLIVLDTLAKNMAGDGDSNEVAGAALRNVERITARFGAQVVLVHHTGHGDKSRERGASSLRGGIDASFQVTRPSSLEAIMYCKKQKTAEEFDPVKLKLDSVVIDGLLDDGDPVTTLVCEYVSQAVEEPIVRALRRVFYNSQDLEIPLVKLVDLVKANWSEGDGECPGKPTRMELIKKQDGKLLTLRIGHNNAHLYRIRGRE